MQRAAVPQDGDPDAGDGAAREGRRRLHRTAAQRPGETGDRRVTTTMFWKMVALTSFENDNAIFIYFLLRFQRNILKKIAAVN